MTTSADLAREGASNTGSPVIAVRDLRVETATGQPIVDGINLSLADGEILGVVGESGSGKTTTALSLFGFTSAGARFASGEIEIAGHKPFDLVRSKNLRALRGHYVSYVPQSPGTSLNPSMRIGRALQEMQNHRNRGERPGRGDLKQERAEVLQTVGLPSSEEFQRRFPHQLSGGQQQRVCLAVALLSGSSTIVLDEPTTGLDVVTQAQVLDELRRLQRDLKVSIVYISHDLAVVAQLATRVAVMYAGKVVETGPTEDILRNPAHPYTRGLLSSTPDHSQLGRVQAMPGVAVSLAERAEDACAFAPRCPKAQSDCTQAEPQLLQITGTAPIQDQRAVACYHPIGEPFKLTMLETPAAHVPDKDCVLAVRNLSVEHRVRGRKVAAVTGVDFEVARGECLAVVGESGSGKSTIARTIAGLQKHQTGTITLHGQELAELAANRTVEQRRQLQIVFQNASLALNPKENVQTAISRSSALLPKDQRHSISELMDLVRLPRGLAQRLPRELSGGERQRVAIARALATRPELMICDEITSALDVSVQAAVLTLVDDLRAQLGLSLLFITHDLGVVSSLADRVMVLEAGSVCEMGAARQVLDEPASPYAKNLMAAAPSLASALQ